MDAPSFHHWAVTLLAEQANADISPAEVSNAIIARIQKGQMTWLATMEATAKAWMGYDAHHDASYHGSDDYLRQLLPRIAGDVNASARLMQLRAETSARQGRPAEALQLAKDAHTQLLALEYAITLRRIQNELLAASLAYTTGDTAAAETHYLDVLSCNWANVEDYATLESLRTCYVEAARGLIQVRQGKLSALQNIYFFPAVAEELQPLLDEAIQKAQGAGR